MRLLKEGTITTFLCRLLVALALLALPSVSRVLRHLANNAVFVIAHEELVMGQGKVPQHDFLCLQRPLLRALFLAPFGPHSLQWWMSPGRGMAGEKRACF